MTTPNTSDFATFSKGVDFGKAATDYRKFRAGFPQEFFERIARQLNLRSGLQALDLGTGTGTVARGLAELGLEVIGLDPSDALMEQAVALDAEAGVSVEYRVGRAEELPFESEAFDLVTAGQCWHWFDRPRAAAECMRALKPGARLIICHFDWIPLPGNMVGATEAMILEANPQWLPMSGGTGVYPQWLGDLAIAGFCDLETASFDVAQTYSHEAWIGRIKASLDEAATEQFAERLAAMLKADFPDDPLAVPHRVWWVSARKPA